MSALTQPKLSLEAYRAWENAQPEKHEFHRGEVFAMVGARRVHAMGDGNVLEVASLSLRMPMADVFAGIDPPA